MKTTLYLGTSPSHHPVSGHLIHYPVIKIVPKDSLEVKRAFDDLEEFTHIIFTSKNAVRVFFSQIKALGKSASVLEKKILIAIGTVTAAHLQSEGFSSYLIAEEETQEGIIHELKLQNLENAYLFLPRSALSRPALVDFLASRGIRHQVCDLYDTVTQKTEPVPNLEAVDEIVFASPSTVKGFLEIFGPIPKNKKIVALGPITEEAIRKAMT